MNLLCTFYRCGELLVQRHDRALGRISFVCVGCERTKLGLCRDCPSRVTRNRLRCDGCARARTTALDRRRKRKRAADPRLRAIDLKRKRTYNAKPEVRARRRAAQAGRKTIRDDGDRLYHREWMRRKRQDPAWTAANNARRRARHAERASNPAFLAKQAARFRLRRQNAEARASENARRRQRRQQAKAVAA